MNGSGLHELLSTIYAENSTSHILDGNAISRAIRAHVLTYRVLFGMILSNAYGILFPLLGQSDSSDGISEAYKTPFSKVPKTDNPADVATDDDEFTNNESDTEDSNLPDTDNLPKFPDDLEQAKKLLFLMVPN